MTAWIAWTVFMTALFAIAAAAVERIAAFVGAPRRFIWAVAMAGSVLLPAMLATRSSQTASSPTQSTSLPTTPRATEGSDRVVPRPRALENRTIDGAENRSPRQRFVAFGLAILGRIDPWVVPAWVIGSIGLFVVFVRALIGLRQESARWHEADAGMCRVLVSRDTGPAVFGFLRPRIVVPAWALIADRSTRDLLLRHELEHMRTGDSRVLIVAALATMLFPWNAALWWMSRRLRLAIEIDCDTRVIQAVGAPREYGLVLLAVSDRLGTGLPHATALSEPGVSLETRIHAMTAHRPRRPILASLPYAAITLGVVTTAAWSPRPSTLVRGQRMSLSVPPAPTPPRAFVATAAASAPAAMPRAAAQPTFGVVSAVATTGSAASPLSSTSGDPRPLRGNPAPRYPEQLVRSGTEGVVIMTFSTDARGVPDTATIRFVASTDVLFVQSIVDVLPRWRFDASGPVRLLFRFLSSDTEDKEAAGQPRPSYMADSGPLLPVIITFAGKGANRTPPPPQGAQDTVSFNQIVIAPRPSAAAKEVARVRAESVFAQIKNGGDFDKIAKRESTRRDPNGIGIDLGWVNRGDMPPVIARSLFGSPYAPALSPGQISPVIDTPFGYAVLRIYQVQPGAVRTSQILIQPEIDSVDVARARLTADSVAAMLRGGLSFDALAQRYHDFADNEETTVSMFPRDSLPVSYRNALRSARPRDVVVFEMPGLHRPEVPNFVVAQLTSIH